MYRAVRRVLFLVAPERIHTWVFAVLRAVTAPRPMRRAFTKSLAPRDPVLASTVFGVRFPGPLGLAAGFDKNGLGLAAWGALGFGYAEVGTVTAQAQPGNPAPRMFRLPDDRALLNRLGFNNHGAGRAGAATGAGTSPTCRSGSTSARPRSSRPRAPSTTTGKAPGWSGRWPPTWWSMSARPTRRACATCRPSSRCGRFWPRCANETSTPVLVKIAPDLSDSDIDEIADLAVELGLAGIVATNTTVSRDGLATPGVDELGPGGISGPPVARRSAEVLRRLYRRVGDRLVLISVGGIETADDAWDRITAGASLLQGYTGFIYGGGLWAKHIHDGIARKLHEGGFASLADAVGSAAS